jgi:hypothetical protein
VAEKDSKGDSPNRGVKKGLPTIGLPEAEEMAAHVWEVARLGKVSASAIAGQLGLKDASGSTWRTKIAVLRGFGLIDSSGDQIGLTKAGQDLVNGSDPARQRASRRLAMMNLKAYRDLILSYDGTPLPDLKVIASRMRFEFGKAEDFADRAARAFVSSLSHAQMIDSANVVNKGGVGLGTGSAEVSVDVEEDQDRDVEIDDAFEEEEKVDELNVAGLPGGAENGAHGKRRGTDVDVTLSLSLDLSKYGADEVIRILRALGVARLD